jgi:hypothetical protein
VQNQLSLENKTAILRNIKTDVLYRHISGTTYRNIATGVSGEIPDEIASKHLVINTELSLMLNKNCQIERLIEGLGLRYEPIK